MSDLRGNVDDEFEDNESFAKSLEELVAHGIQSVRVSASLTTQIDVTDCPELRYVLKQLYDGANPSSRYNLDLALVGTSPEVIDKFLKNEGTLSKRTVIARGVSPGSCHLMPPIR